MTKIKEVYHGEDYRSLSDALIGSNESYKNGYQVHHSVYVGDGAMIVWYELRNKQGRKVQGFSVPDAKACKEYFKSKGFQESDGKEFHEYWERSNWHDKMGMVVKNWKGRAATWMGNIERSQSKQTTADYTNL